MNLPTEISNTDIYRKDQKYPNGESAQARPYMLFEQDQETITAGEVVIEYADP